MDLGKLSLDVARRRAEQPSRVDAVRAAPPCVLQIGSGNFLRAFAGWMFERLNQRGLLTGGIVVSQATPHGRTTQQLAEQDHCYTVVQRGLQDGRLIEQTDVVTCVVGTVNPFENWAAFLQAGAAPSLRYVVSNTTEAGIVYQACDYDGTSAPASFPAQVAALLHHRFQSLGASELASLVFLPCELIESNGSELCRIVLQHARDWKLGSDFDRHVREACVFCNTLVDRIVPGYPKDEASAIQQRLGYRDDLLVASEWYHSWVIEGPASLQKELPLGEAGFNVTWTDDVRPYRTRKVRLLNGAHTSLVAAAFLSGCDTVLQAMQDERLGRFVERTLMDEIVPTLDAPRTECEAFARDTLDRFRNPTIQHRWLSIALNSTSKWKVRVLPSLVAFVERQSKIPPRLAFSLAALIALYRVRVNEKGVGIGQRAGQSYEIADAREALELFENAWRTYDAHEDAWQLCQTVLGARQVWDADLNGTPGLTDTVVIALESILHRGMSSALEDYR